MVPLGERFAFPPSRQRPAMTPLIPQLHIKPMFPQLGPIIEVNRNTTGSNTLGSKKQTGFITESSNGETKCPTKKLESICLTPGCVKAAYSILVNLDQSINPCDDFYEFACGNFEKTRIIPDDKAELTLIGEMTDTLNQQIRTVIEDLMVEEDSSISPSSLLVKNLYSSCINQGKMVMNGNK